MLRAKGRLVARGAVSGEWPSPANGAWAGCGGQARGGSGGLKTAELRAGIGHVADWGGGCGGANRELLPRCAGWHKAAQHSK